MEGKSCYDVAVGKEDILTILEVHMLTNSGNVNGDHRDQEGTCKIVSASINFLLSV